MRKTSFVTGLCLALSLFFAAALQAEELKSFLTLKVADPGTLMSVAEKIADLSGQRRDFDAGVASFKDMKGLNKKGPLGLVLQTDGEEIKNPVLILPIENLDEVDLPNFDALMANAKKEGEGKYVVNSPMGVFNLQQKKGCVLISSVDANADLPEDVSKLFAGLESHTLALRLDLENTTLDAVEMLLSPVMLIMAMQGDQMAQMAENVTTTLETLYKECRSLTIGFTFDAKTAATEFVVTTVPKKGSDSEKQFAALKNMKTAFSGFLGSGSNVVFSFGAASVALPSEQETAMAAVDQFLDGLLDQAEEQAETDEDFELAEKVAASFRKIVEATLKQEKSDYACSLTADATFLGAVTLGDTNELKSLIKLVYEHFKGKIAEGNVDSTLEKYLKKEYTTVAGYKISSLVLPLADFKDGDLVKALNVADKTVAVYWGVKENEAVAAAFGWEAQATEQRFTEALNKTATPVAVKRPEAVFSFQPLGKLLETYVPEEAKDETMKKIVDLLTAASNDARVTLATRLADEAMEIKFAATGSAVETFVNLFRVIGDSEAADSQDSSTIRDF